MSISETTLKALKELGLTEYEVQAYIALVDGGQMTASDISSQSRVPFSRVYDVLGRLEDKGFIQIQRGRPTIYIGKAPTEIVKLVQLAWAEKLEKSSKIVVDDLQPRFEQETQATTRDVWLLHGRAAILAKALEMIETAKEEILFSLPSLDMEAISESFEIEDLTEIIEAILKLKVPKACVLTSDVPEDLKEIIPKNVEIRSRDKVFGAGLVVDRRETIIMLAGGTAESEFLGVYSSALVFANMASLYFDSLWSESSPV
ncbi:MAG: TrmB family transcriptional regulator [Candidatus Thorarchaeota archaeon]